MAFKLNNPPYDKKLFSTPIYHVDMEDDVMGKLPETTFTIPFSSRIESRIFLFI